MKKVFTLTLTTLALALGVNKAQAQVEQGNFLIDSYVGGPTGNMWWGSISSQYADFKTVGAPISFGNRFEYMVADNFGVGTDVNFVQTGYEYTIEDWNYDPNTGTYTDATQGYKADKLRVMLRLNYHIVQTGSFDAYLGVGAGYKHVKRVWTIDGEVDGSAQIPTLIPVAFRLAFGGRYYFNNWIGINFEIGAGGGTVVQGGAALKF